MTLHAPPQLLARLAGSPWVSFQPLGVDVRLTKTPANLPSRAVIVFAVSPSKRIKTVQSSV